LNLKEGAEVQQLIEAENRDVKRSMSKLKARISLQKPSLRLKEYLLAAGRTRHSLVGGSRTRKALGKRSKREFTLLEILSGEGSFDAVRCPA
jgi:hypothetical protein